MKRMIFIFVAAASLAACNAREPNERVLAGAAIGAGTGAVLGAVTTGAPGGALAGAAIGGVAGGVIGDATSPRRRYSGYCRGIDDYGRRYSYRC